MKILLDENIDVRFRNLFDIKSHQINTVRSMDWLGIKNGKLLDLLEKNSFDIFITADKNLPYQQNLTILPVCIIILNVKRNLLTTITRLFPQVKELISAPIQKKIFVLSETNE